MCLLKTINYCLNANKYILKIFYEWNIFIEIQYCYYINTYLFLCDDNSDKSGRILKEVTKSNQNKMAHCNHQYQVVKKSKEPQVCKEGCAEHGPVKNQKESKRCDCPHCEVFENVSNYYLS